MSTNVAEENLTPEQERTPRPVLKLAGTVTDSDADERDGEDDGRTE